MRRKIIVAILLAVTISCRSTPPVQNQIFKEEYEIKHDEIDKLIDKYAEGKCTSRGGEDCTSPGVALMVIQGDKVVLEKYQGAANVAERIPIDENTVFDLASVSKQFTAMAIILLRAQGKLESYDDNLAKFFTSTTFPDVNFDPEIAQNVTVRQLLNHTSGLKDVTTLYYDGPTAHPACVQIHNHYPRSSKAFKEDTDEPTAREALKCIADQKVGDRLFQPGEPKKWSYNNAGYIILAQIVERLSGERFRDFMKKNIFEPLKMDHTFVKDENPDSPVISTLGYDRGVSEYNDISYTPLNKIYGDGNVHSTLQDMAKWDRAINVIFDEANYPGERPLVERRIIDEAFEVKAQTDTNPKILYSAGWLFGYYRGDPSGNKDLMWHRGAWAGFRTMILRIFGSNPSEHLTVIVLSNNAMLPPGVVGCTVAKIYLRELEGVGDVPHLNQDQLQRVVTNYHTTRPGEFDESFKEDDITLEGEDLFVKDKTREKYKLVFSARETEQESKDDGEAEDTCVFYLQGLEGFDIFRYDVKGENIFTPPRIQRMEMDPRAQRNSGATAAN